KVVISLNRVVAWLAQQAEELGVQVFPGFAAAEILFESDAGTGSERVAGVRTRDTGIDKHGHRKPGFQAGMDIRAPVTVFGEGPRGSLAKHLIRRHALDAGKNPQTYGTGVKELWEVPPERGAQWLGRVMHTLGWPLDTRGYGGGWVYGLTDNRLS